MIKARDLVVDSEADEDRLQHQQSAHESEDKEQQEPHVHEALAEECEAVVCRELVPLLHHGQHLSLSIGRCVFVRMAAPAVYFAPTEKNGPTFSP